MLKIHHYPLLSSYDPSVPALITPNPYPVTIAIPAFNEERFIGSVVIQALRHNFQVLVIDDGSRDATAYIAEQAGATVLRHCVNKGKSGAVNTALEWARQHDVEILVFLDGDGQHRPDEIGDVVAPILMGQADMVIGSRFLCIKSKIPAYRQVGQYLLTTATNLSSNVRVTDSQSGFRAFSRRAIELLHFSGTGLSVESEMQFLAKEHELKVAEVPISVIYSEKAKRNPFSHGMQIITNITKLIGQHRPLFFFGFPGLITLLAGILIGLLTLSIYSRTQELAMGYALIAVLFSVIGMLSIFAGLILHSVKAFFQDLKKTVQAKNLAQGLYARNNEVI